MHYLISGGTGFIGTALIETLLRDGSSVTVLTRQSRQGRGPLNFVTSLDTMPADTRVDAVVNLGLEQLNELFTHPSYCYFARIS